MALLAYAVGLGLAIAVIVRRYRRSGQLVRTQIRWVAAASVVPVILFPLLFVDWMWSLWFLSTALLPIAIGIAILRYRLYDIDRIIGRTLSYAIVTASLAAVFVGSNLVLQAAIAGATGGSTLAVAGSTLLVAALFQPVRRRVQDPIDRRFNRAHLDAERVVRSFAGRARDEVDLGRLREAVVGVVVDAVRPARGRDLAATGASDPGRPGSRRGHPPVKGPGQPLPRPAAGIVWLLAIGVPAGMLALVAASPTPEQDAWAIPLYSGIVATWVSPGRSSSPGDRTIASGGCCSPSGLASAGPRRPAVDVLERREVRRDRCRGPRLARSWDCCSARRSSSSCSCRCCSRTVA